ncbi:hypothetical protein BKA63DRAFT_522641 [Paraphoma chrysanthemicola]|nr:hypothetical protein BKA63DRAFT_522641 [Paraphoma chrysanthemicola]
MKTGTSKLDEADVEASNSGLITDLPEYDKAHSTKKFCVAGIWFSALLGMSCLATCGPVFQHRIHDDSDTQGVYILRASSLMGHVISLCINMVVAACTDVLGYVHATSLRWTLVQEGRLEYNSNLRLFTSSKNTWANGKIVNTLSGLFLALSYAASSQLLILYDDIEVDEYRTLYVNGIAFIMLGVGLLGLSAVAILSLSTQKAAILTWSPNPLDTALACLHNEVLHRRPGRGMMSVNMATLSAQPIQASALQRPARDSYKQIKNMARVVWVALAISCVLTGVVCGLSVYLNPASPKHWVFFGMDHYTYLNFFIAGPNTLTEDQQSLICLVLFFLFGLALQASISVPLHCMELIVNVTRDETAWRHAATRKGTSLHTSGLMGALQSWQWWILFVMKPFAQWLFSSASVWSLYLGTAVIVSVNAIPLAVLTGVMIFLTLLGEYLARKTQKGPQPVAYGHLQTIVDLIDDWGEGSKKPLYWGVKYSVVGAMPRVGTSGSPITITPVEVGKVYQG